MGYLFIIFIFACWIALVMLVVRLVLYPFSAKIRAEVKRHLVIHWVWGCIAVLGVVSVCWTVNVASQAVKRHKQMQHQQERSHPPTTNAQLTNGNQ